MNESSSVPFSLLVLATIVPISVSALDTPGTVATADAFVTAGSADPNAGLPNGNYGGAGALMISPAGSAKGEIESLLKFNLASTKTTFDTAFGAGNWVITGVKLQLGTNTGIAGTQPINAIFNTIQGGLFGFDWLANDNWGEGTGNPMNPFFPSNPPVDGVTFNSLSSLLSAADRSLGINTYTPPGTNTGPAVPYTLALDSSFVSDIMAGGDVSLRGYAADSTVGFLFNARSLASNKPTLVVSAQAVPEPGTGALLVSTAVLGCTRRRRHAQTD